MRGGGGPSRSGPSAPPIQVAWDMFLVSDAVGMIHGITLIV